MKYISAEEFLKQPIEVQKVFVDWWKCDLGDLYFVGFGENMVKVINEDVEGDIEGDWDWFKSQYHPLLTEGQIRKFIEDKTNGVIKVIQWNPEKLSLVERGYKIYIDILDKDKYIVLNHYECSNLGTDLIQAYWKVAIKIANEGV